MSQPATNQPAHPAADFASGWNAHRQRQLNLDAWLAHEDALAAAVDAGRVVDISELVDSAHALDGVERESMLRAAFQRWTTTWEAVLQLRLELGDTPAEAVRVAQERAVEVRAAEWRAIRRARGTDVADEQAARQRGRVARVTGLDRQAVEQAMARAEAATERATSYAVPARLRIRRARRLRRPVLARRAV